MPALIRGDAVGNGALQLQRLFRSWGLDSSIFCTCVEPRLSKVSSPVSMFDRVDSDDNVVILHYGAYSEEVDVFERARGTKVLVYHNITPGRFFLKYSLRHYYVTELARYHVGRVIRAAQLSLAPSLYSCKELRRYGAVDCLVVPPLIDFDQLDSVIPDSKTLERYADGTTNIIFVGRVAPHKKHEDIVGVFGYYREHLNQRSRLFLIGSYAGLEPYYDAVKDQVRRAGLEGAVVFTGHVGIDELVAYYRLSHVFLCLSEHEGFGVPLLEAMHFGLPVIAYGAAAVPQTLGDAGVLVREKDCARISEAIHHVVSSDTHRRVILGKQQRRLRDFAPGKISSMLKLYLCEESGL